LSLPFFAFYHLANLIFNLSKISENKDIILWLIIGISVSLTLMTLLVIISVKLLKDYEKKFKKIA